MSLKEEAKLLAWAITEPGTPAPETVLVFQDALEELGLSFDNKPLEHNLSKDVPDNGIYSKHVAWDFLGKIEPLSKALEGCLTDWGDEKYVGEIRILLKSMHASDDQIRGVLGFISRLDDIKSEAVNSAEENNVSDWDETYLALQVALGALGIDLDAIQDDIMGLSFPYEEWRAMMDDQEEENEAEDFPQE
jgi:hypothetical protein